MSAELNWRRRRASRSMAGPSGNGDFLVRVKYLVGTRADWYDLATGSLGVRRHAPVRPSDISRCTVASNRIAVDFEYSSWADLSDRAARGRAVPGIEAIAVRQTSALPSDIAVAIPWSAYAIVVLTTLIWGGTNVASKIGVGIAPIAGLAAVRFLIAAVCLAILLALTERQGFAVRGRDWPMLAALAITGVVASNLLFFWGLTLAPVTDAALLGPAISPLATAALAVLFLGERYSRRQLLGMGVSLVGVVFVLGAAGLDPTGGPGRLLGDGLLILSSVTWSIYTVIGRRALTRFSPLATVTWATLLGTIPLLLIAAPGGWSWLVPGTPTLWATILFLALLGTVVGMLTWSWSVRDLGAARAGQFTYLMPVWVLLMAALFLNEYPLPIQLGGAVLVFIGIWIANRATRPVRSL